MLGAKGDIRAWAIQSIIEDAVKGRPAYLQNLDQDVEL